MEKENETLKTQFFPKVIHTQPHYCCMVHGMWSRGTQQSGSVAPTAADTAGLTTRTSGITIAE